MDCPIRVHNAEEEEEEEAEAANTNCSVRLSVSFIHLMLTMNWLSIIFLSILQNPADADNLFRIQRELDETKIMLMFYKQAKKTNQCCTIL